MISLWKNILLGTLISAMLIGCSERENSSPDESATQATAKLGNLADANVTIYKIEDNGTLISLYFEKTSSGTTLGEIGKFDMHIDTLDDNLFYLYEVTGGKDWDSNDDGILDTNATINKGIIRAIAKGSSLKVAADNFIVSYATELIYEKITPTLKYHFNASTFGAKLQDAIKKVIGDIDGDGAIDEKDMLIFNPHSDESKLIAVYSSQAQKIKDILHNGKILSLNLLSKLGSYDTAGWAEEITLSNDGTKAYVADGGNGLVVIDISNPVNPSKLGSYTAGYANGVALSNDGTKAYVADGDNGLVIVDISDPAHPSKLGSYDTAGYANGVTLSSDGTKAYVADNNNGLVVVDISNPPNLSKLDSYNTAGSAYGVTLSNYGAKAYAADGNNGLVVINISNPTNLSKLDSYNTASWARDVTLSNDGTKAYVADDRNGLVVVDIRDPENLSKLGSYDTAGWAFGVVLSSDGTKAYVADYKNGLVVIDISNPANPNKLNSYDTAGSAEDITLSNDGTKAYVADGGNGLVVIDLTLYR